MSLGLEAPGSQLVRVSAEEHKMAVLMLPLLSGHSPASLGLLLGHFVLPIHLSPGISRKVERKQLGVGGKGLRGQDSGPAGQLEARTPGSIGGWGPHLNVQRVTGARNQARVCHVGKGQSLCLPELVYCLKNMTSLGCCEGETYHNMYGESPPVARLRITSTKCWHFTFI